MPIDDPDVLLKDPEMSRDFLNHVLGTKSDTEPRPADAKHLEGAEVVIHGLKGRPELNGQRGRALKWNPEANRIGVELGEGMVKLSVRAGMCGCRGRETRCQSWSSRRRRLRRRQRPRPRRKRSPRARPARLPQHSRSR